MIHTIPRSTCRSSRLGRPSPGFCLGNSSLTRAHWASVRRPAALLARRGVVVALPSPESAGSRSHVLHDHHRGRRWHVLPCGPPRGSASPPPGGLDETETILAGTPFALRDPSSRGSAALPPVWWVGSARGRDAARDPPFNSVFLLCGCGTHHRQVGMREQAKGYVALPTVPLPYLVLTS